jgi:hypothetical protein
MNFVTSCQISTQFLVINKMNPKAPDKCDIWPPMLSNEDLHQSQGSIKVPLYIP